MTPGAYIALARDLGIIAALGFILWYVHRADINQVKVADFRALQLQQQANAAQESKWRQQADVSAQHEHAALADVTRAIAAQHTPILLRSGPSRSCPVSTIPLQTPSQPSGSGGSDPTTGGDLDVRPRINDYELWVEQHFSECRTALGSWP